MKVSVMVFMILMWIGPCDDPFISSKLKDAGTCVDVSWVAGICGEAVLKIESKDYQSLGESWNGNEHVFFTVLPCETDDQKLQSGIFKVLIRESNTPDFGDCIRCKATIAYSGKNKYEIAFPSTCSE